MHASIWAYDRGVDKDDSVRRGPTLAEVILLSLALAGALAGGLFATGVLPPSSNSPMSTETATPTLSSYLTEGQRLYDQGIFDLAIVQFDNAIEIDSNALAYGWRGSAYYALGQYQRAIQDYDQAIRLEPNAVGYNNRGAAYSWLSLWQQAVQDYSQAIHLNPEYAVAYESRGNAYYWLSLRTEAQLDWDTACWLDRQYC